MRENQRVRLSRQLLKESLVKLLKDKTIQKISVREICANAEINRTTFYKYYGSQFDLLEDIENEFFENIKNSLSSTNFQELDMEYLLTFIIENEELCKVLFDNSINLDFSERLLNFPLFHQNIVSLIDIHYPENMSEYTHKFVINGGFDIIKCWLHKKDRESPAEIAHYMEMLMNRL